MAAAAWALSLALLLLLLEVAGAVYFSLPGTKPVGGLGYPKDLFVAKEGVDYGYAPNYRGHFEGSYGGVRLETNAEGFRDPDWPPPSPDRLRVAVLGDSVPFGPGVEAGGRLTDLLPAALGPAADGRPVEALNLGVNSYAYMHYAALLRSDLMRRLRPDAVVVLFTLNDIQWADSAWPLQILERRAAMGAAEGALERVRYWFDRRNSVQLVRALAERAAVFWMSRDEREAYHTKWMRKMRSNWENGVIYDHLRDRIAESKAGAEALGAPLLVAVLPELNDVRRPEEFGFAREGAARLLAEAGLPHCLLHDQYLGLPNLEAHFLPGDSLHFSPEGHRHAAAALARCLRGLRPDLFGAGGP